MNTKWGKWERITTIVTLTSKKTRVITSQKKHAKEEHHGNKNRNIKGLEQLDH